MAKQSTSTGIVALGATADAPAPPRFATDSMFAASRQPVLIVDSVTEGIVEANPAAARLLGVDRSVLVGMPLSASFDAPSMQALQQALNRARAPMGMAVSIRVRALCSGRPLHLKLSTFLANQRAYVLAHLSAGAPSGDSEARESASSEVLRAIDAAPVGFLVTDSGFFVEYANPAFGEMVGQDICDGLRGKSAIRWLKFSALDLERLREQKSRRQAAIHFSVALRSVAKPVRRVEVCAVAVPDGQDPCCGFTIRELTRLN